MNEHNNNNNNNNIFFKFLKSIGDKKSTRKELTEKVWLLSTIVSKRVWNI